MKHIYLLLLALFGLHTSNAQNTTDFKIFGRVMYTDKSSVEGWEVAIAGDNNFQIVLKTDKNGLYSQVTQVELGKVTNFTISVKDPCQNAAQVQKTSYSGRSQTSGTIDFIICKSVVGSGCPVKFSFTQSADGTFLFVAEPDYPGAVYSWDFGDGTQDTGKEVKHKYGRNGAYAVTLIVKTSNCSSSFTQKLNATGVVNPPTPNYSANASCCGKLNVRAIGATSSSTGLNYKFIATADYKINEVIWDFGDGKTGTGIETTHQYDSVGTYKVTAKIIGDNCIIQMMMTVQVTDRKVNNPCAFDFGYTYLRSGEIQFNSKINSKYDKLLWEFGDGTTSSDENPLHAYTKGGEYKVSLTITINGVPCTITKTIKVSGVVNSPCPTDFDVKLDSLTAKFSFSSTTKPDSLIWSFGDGNTSKEESPVHVYAKDGNYTVFLVLYFNGVPCKVAKNIKAGNVRGTTVEISISEVNPNPALNDLTVNIKSNGDYKVELIIAHMTGANLQQYSIDIVSGVNKVPLMVGSLQPGSYVVLVYYNGVPVSKALFQKL